MTFPFVLIAAYFAFTCVIAFRSSRSQATSNSFLNATGKLPTWVATLSFLAANCGALEIVGLSGVTRRYGVQAFHFYWIGAIPAMIFVSFVMLPLYQRAGARSIPEYLERRFGRGVRLLNACMLLMSTCLTAGISLYALAAVLNVFGGWSFTTCLLVTAAVVLVNMLIGGFRGTMRTEVLHFFAMLTGLLPLLYLSRNFAVHRAETWSTYGHAWTATPFYSTKAPVDVVGIVFGLGMIIGFSYWCTDFLLMQRALAAHTAEAARRVPLYAGFGKLLFGFLVVLPVLSAGQALNNSGQGSLDQTAPLLMRSLYSPRFLAVGMIAIIASLMAGVGGNVSAFAALWTEEIYRPSLRPGRTEEHYIWTGRAASAVCVALGLGGAYATLWFESLSQFILAIFSLTLVPFFAVMVAGTFSRRSSPRNIIASVLSGVAMGGTFQVAYRAHWLQEGSALSANFHAAILTFLTTLVACVLGSVLFGHTRSQRSSEPNGFELPAWWRSKFLYVLAGLLLGCCVLLNVIWR